MTLKPGDRLHRPSPQQTKDMKAVYEQETFEHLFLRSPTPPKKTLEEIESCYSPKITH